MEYDVIVEIPLLWWCAVFLVSSVGLRIISPIFF